MENENENQYDDENQQENTPKDIIYNNFNFLIQLKKNYILSNKRIIIMLGNADKNACIFN